MIKKLRVRHTRLSVAPGVGICGAFCGALAAVLVAAGSSAAYAQSLTPPTIVAVQAAVTTPPTIPPATLPPATIPQVISPQLGSLATPNVSAATTIAQAGSKSPGLVASRYSDPLADMASAALEALRSGGVNSGTQMFAAVQEPAVPSVKGTPLTRPPAPQPGAGTWSSVVIDTASLSDFLSGTAVAAPISPSASAALAALPTEPAARYTATLRSLAVIVGARSKVDAAALETVWLRTDVRRMRTVLTAMAQVGTMYRAAGNQPGGFDCSGLTSYAWAQAGVKIPRTSTDQINAAAPRSPDQLLPGDVIWRPGHIGLYLGAGDAMVHSSQTGKPVEVRAWGRALRWGSPL